MRFHSAYEDRRLQSGGNEMREKSSQRCYKTDKCFQIHLNLMARERQQSDRDWNLEISARCLSRNRLTWIES